MPLVLLSGQPCCGKSTIAGQLAEHLRGHGLEVIVVSVETVGLERNAAYKGTKLWLATKMDALTSAVAC